MSIVVEKRVATPDPPPTGIPNPIHDAEGADDAGYAGALVAGVRTYGWAAHTIAKALGHSWLASGWVDFSLRRPLFAGEELTTTVSDPAPGADGPWPVECIGRGQGGERVVLDGEAGLGPAPWASQLDPPPPTPGVDPPAVRPTYDLTTIPFHEPLHPLRVHVTAEAARRLITDDLGLDIDDQRHQGPGPTAVPIPPHYLAGRMAPLTRHNFTYGPTIHVRSQIQHRAIPRPGQDITVGARFVDAYARNDHWYQVLDGLVSGNIDGELALIRHHTIFRPRGTTMPEPIRSS
ncbi:MAG: MaoC family dehydratase [Actinomycetia bacterium]|nr:MaoC family dehydratase [Actinomycetes bacterium]MCP4224934.1 MaoC family dehydratase [Actinomycetes bacterium]MCP5035498.1 MaoC family dehydratase [Actinomycetes bacterium]